MNRCAICGRKLKNAETTSGIEFCKYCDKYEQRLIDKDKEIDELKQTINIAHQKFIEMLAIELKDQRHYICEGILQHLEDSKMITPENPKERLKMPHDVLITADSVNACLFDIMEFVKNLDKENDDEER